MINELIQYLKDKKILILGYGREGKSSYTLIRKHLKNQLLYIADIKEEFWKDDNELKNDKNVIKIDGDKYLKDLNTYDIILKSPGISFKGMDTSTFINKITSQAELLLEFFKIKTIGITGTKGKSTTSSLIYNMIKDQEKDVVLLGNIGIPIFNYIDEMKEDMYVVIEFSSHQLQYMKKSPNIAILLNMAEEHLDHYNSFEEYLDAKMNIFNFQDKEDYCLYNSDNEIVLRKMQEHNYMQHKYEISIENIKKTDDKFIYLKENKVYNDSEVLYTDAQTRRLIGRYQLNNIMFVVTVAKILKLDLIKAEKSINEFKGLEHRLEYVGKYNDITYYNDSIATVPMSTEGAIETLKNINTLIIGGKDRGIDYEEFIDFLNKKNIANIICMPDTGIKIAKKLTNGNVIVVKDLKEAVEKAKKVTIKGSICLLSPAASSYGFFKNFEDRGNQFKNLVNNNN